MRFYALIIIVVLALGVSAQTGPGGVGKNDGTSDLVLWLDANTVSGTNGSTITTWNDQSGYSYNFTVGNGAVYNTNVQNGYPAFNFNGTSHYFQRAYTANLSTSTFTIFAADNVTSSSKHKAVFSNRDDPAGSATAGFILYAIPNNNRWEFWTGKSSGSWDRVRSNSSTTGNWASQTISYTSSTNGKKIYINGELKGQDTQTLTNNSSKPFRVGAGKNESTSPRYYFNGNIGEIIMYKVVLNDAQRYIVQNYLSAKYNYALAANDLYVGDNSGNGNYDKYVIGIGTESNGSQLKSIDGKGLTIEQNSGFTNGEYLLAGHTESTNQNIYTDISGVAGLDARWKRIWYFDITGTISVNITFDISEGGFSGNAGTTSNYKLLYRAGTSGNWTDAGTASSVSGDKIVFSNNSLSNGDGYYTIGTLDMNNSTLPIELFVFDAMIEDNIVKLQWQTVTETNNDYFNIERSQDGQQWEIIGRINGAGNSNKLQNYTAIDNNPNHGINYYRLKQIDFDGSISYSDIRRVQIIEESNINIFPNPVQNILSIEGVDLQKEDVRVYNALGQEVSSLIDKSEIKNDNLIFDLSNLPTGLYYVRIGEQLYKVFKL